jgi:hypothetical protein
MVFDTIGDLTPAQQGAARSHLAMGATTPSHPAHEECYARCSAASCPDLRRLGDSCGSVELSRCDPDDALEVVGELALVSEAGARGNYRQGEIASLV